MILVQGLKREEGGVLGSDDIHNLSVYSIIQYWYYITIVITCFQYKYK